MIADHYLTRADVITLHGALCSRFGGVPGVRNLPLLESTLADLKAAGHADILAQATTLFERLAFERPFVEGHLRIAFAATDVFLRINGHRVARNAQSLLADLMRMSPPAGGRVPVGPWLRGVVHRADAPRPAG
ncbi:MAG TPA: type II toxin-antitoxin system death-on-curing family toxin [Burkholderiaceae bacterium]|mgnify:CR=1 FL=1|jgi:death-on-curing protein|nr:type II toxin-antitoxin system death-on-curing family toxin [Burkholderiaceae bacterium]